MQIAIDTETALISRACVFPPISCLTFFDEKERSGIYAYRDNKIASFVSNAIERGDHLIMHNAPFDTGVLAEEYPDLLQPIFSAYENGQIHCIKIRQKLLDIALGLLSADGSGEKNIGFYTNRFDGKRYLIKYSLKDLHFRRTGEELEKGQERVTFGPLRDVPLAQWPDKHRMYAIKDARVTLPIFQAQDDPRLAYYLQDELAQTRAAFCLQLITSHGLRTDPEYVAKLRQVTQAECNKYEPILKEIEWLVKGTLKQKPAQQRVFSWATKNQTWPKLTKAGLKTDKANDKIGKTTALVDEQNRVVLIKNNTKEIGKTVTLKQLSIDKEAAEDTQDKDLLTRAKYSSARGVLTKTIPILEKGYKLPIQPSYDSLLATGRTSSYGERKRKASDPEPATVGDNIQNQKNFPGVRDCYVARDGYVVCSIDYDGAELHTLGQINYSLFGWSRLRDVLNDGKDAHLEFAAKVAKVPYEQAEVLKKKSDKQIKMYRDIAKPFNFGKWGGMGNDSFQAFAKKSTGGKVRLTLKEVAKYDREWKETYPETLLYFKYVGKEVRSQGGKAQIKHLFSNRYRGGCRYTVACNTRFQGLAADGAKAAMWELIKACYLPGYNDILFGSRIVAFIHDEFIFEFRDEHPYRSIAAYEAARIMIEQFNKFTPDCPVTASPVLMYHWSKNAEEVKDEQGYLVPWESTIEEVFNAKS